MMRLHSRTRFLGLLIVGALLAWGAGAPLSLHAEPMEGMKKSAQPEHDRATHDFVGHFLGGVLHHAKDLGLSEDQVSKLKGLSTDYEKARIRGEAKTQPHIVHPQIAAGKQLVEQLRARGRRQEARWPPGFVPHHAADSAAAACRHRRAGAGAG